MPKYTTLAEELSNLPPERQESIEGRARQIRQEEITLKHLRKKLGLSQAELAQRIEVQQPAISKLERRQNWN
jgi:DNA-binding XRE family transcriptional regulator